MSEALSLLELPYPASSFVSSRVASVPSGNVIKAPPIPSLGTAPESMSLIKALRHIQDILHVQDTTRKAESSFTSTSAPDISTKASGYIETQRSTDVQGNDGPANHSATSSDVITSSAAALIAVLNGPNNAQELSRLLMSMANEFELDEETLHDIVITLCDNASHACQTLRDPAFLAEAANNVELSGTETHETVGRKPLGSLGGGALAAFLAKRASESSDQDLAPTTLKAIEGVSAAVIGLLVLMLATMYRKSIVKVWHRLRDGYEHWRMQQAIPPAGMDLEQRGNGQ
jgi:hypothetical protein